MATVAENLQTIKDSTEAIKQAIIDKGVTISGGLTTYANAIKNISGGGSGSTSGAVSKSDVNFYDYDGTLLHSYSKSAFLALSALPDLPTREGLTCQEWNYNLEDAKEYVEEYGKLDIGATYITDDGKTRLYIKIAALGRMSVPLYFSQTVSEGVIIDWGDGSATQTLSGTGARNTTHTYTNIGNYVITLEVTSGTLGLGASSSSFSVMGSKGDNGKVYCNMLQKVEIGSNVTSIGTGAFQNCYSLASIVIPNSVTSIGTTAFQNCHSLASIVIPSSVTSFGSQTFHYCYSLASIVIPNSVTSIWVYAFNNCHSLASIVIPSGVTSIGTTAFGSCYGMSYYDFRSATEVPTLSNTNAFEGIPSDCKIVVPDSLYYSWVAATNWSTYTSYIASKSAWDNGNSGAGGGNRGAED